jgi:hypothetical protein
VKVDRERGRCASCRRVRLLVAERPAAPWGEVGLVCGPCRDWVDNATALWAREVDLAVERGRRAR